MIAVSHRTPKHLQRGWDFQTRLWTHRSQSPPYSQDQFPHHQPPSLICPSNWGNLCCCIYPFGLFSSAYGQNRVYSRSRSSPQWDNYTWWGDGCLPLHHTWLCLLWERERERGESQESQDIQESSSLHRLLHHITCHIKMDPVNKRTVLLPVGVRALVLLCQAGKQQAI